MQNQNSSLTQTMVPMSMPKANMQNQAGSSETAAGAATSTCQSPHSRRRRPHVNSVHFTLPGSFVLCFVTLSLITFGCKVPVRWMSQRLRTAQITRQAPPPQFLSSALPSLEPLIKIAEEDRKAKRRKAAQERQQRMCVAESRKSLSMRCRHVLRQRSGFSNS